MMEASAKTKGNGMNGQERKGGGEDQKARE
jgi:hypothetical protein